MPRYRLTLRNSRAVLVEIENGTVLGDHAQQCRGWIIVLVIEIVIDCRQAVVRRVKWTRGVRKSRSVQRRNVRYAIRERIDEAIARATDKSQVCSKLPCMFALGPRYIVGEIPHDRAKIAAATHRQAGIIGRAVV